MGNTQRPGCFKLLQTEIIKYFSSIGYKLYKIKFYPSNITFHNPKIKLNENFL